ncbi:MAG TPA: tetratricopeptide repeat protein, partial [Melioribacteraceae bacterium]|nr:tetratricopeptide repeat protein [Melioribacteraceae bacterium]
EILDYKDALNYDNKSGIYYSIAKEYLRLNKISNAIQNINKAIELDSINIDYYLLAGQLYSLNRKNDYAIESFEKVINLDSLNYKALFALGELYSANKPRKALEIYNKVLDLIGPEWSVLVNIAELNERMGNVEKTVSTVEELLKINPSNIELQKLLIEAYIKTKQYEKAIALTDEALQSFPDDINLIEYKANSYVKLNKWEEGYKWYKTLIKRSDLDYDNKLRIVTGFLEESDKDSLLVNYTEDLLLTVDKDSTTWQTKVYLAELYVRQKKDSLAIKFFGSACRLAEWNDQLWIRYGGFLFDSRNYDETISEMRIAYGYFPQNFLINLLLAYAYSQKQDHKNAIIYFENCHNLKRDDVSVINGFAFTKYSLGEIDTALVLLDKALLLDSQNAQVYGMMGMIYSKQENFAKSDSSYEKAISLNSEDALLLNNYAYSLSERGLQLERCLEMATKAVTKEPENSSYLDTIGWIYFQLNNYDKAKEYVKKSLEIEPDNATVIDHLGDIYFKLGDKKKAKDYWNEAFKIDKEIKNLRQKIEKGEL